jgi:D-3-phosphoglycerate dehydrogenase
MDQLQSLGLQTEIDFSSTKEEIEAKIQDYQGIVMSFV